MLKYYTIRTQQNIQNKLQLNYKSHSANSHHFAIEIAPITAAFQQQQHCVVIAQPDSDKAATQYKRKYYVELGVVRDCGVCWFENSPPWCSDEQYRAMSEREERVGSACSMQCFQERVDLQRKRRSSSLSSARNRGNTANGEKPPHLFARSLPRIAATTCRHADTRCRKQRRIYHLSIREKRCRENSLFATHMQSVRVVACGAGNTTKSVSRSRAVRLFVWWIVRVQQEQQQQQQYLHRQSIIVQQQL